MLVKSKKYSTVVLVGSTSEIGNAILRKLQYTSSSKIICIGRKNPLITNLSQRDQEIKFIKCDLLESGDVDNAIKNLEKLSSIDLIIIAAGYLPPENQEFSIVEVRNALTVNSVAIPTIVASVMQIMQHQNSGQILLVSSVASMRPRVKNFTYGASKNAADFFTVGLIGKYCNSQIDIKILRPGFVYTKLTRGFKPAPFAINLQVVAKIAVQGLTKKQKIIYAPKKLRFIMNALKLLPTPVFNRLG